VATEAPCPVCGEPLAARPPRCFRCETALGSWWAFEDEMRGLSPAGPARAPWLLSAGLGLAALALALALWTRPTASAPRPGAPVPPPASPAASPVPPAPRAEGHPPVRYTVQRGDSPWRIAAALTGEGRRWRDLWPGPVPKLVPGMVLEVAVAARPRGPAAR